MAAVLLGQTQLACIVVWIGRCGQVAAGQVAAGQGQQDAQGREQAPSRSGEGFLFRVAKPRG
ncbi:hypothetical protein B3C1_00225 [Gallaecimonas xiamenensis 3-C-1]|uniref:Uncharacterized protein n=1 Tax=Gallaecimonas xiamenensis 3-C-1 TaxID=745411 RepID=K2K4G9_9GAMM|nr:hypothetical protein B3C1_00225 [Gallaecimonas xiamenensis 3-C-1]